MSRHRRRPGRRRSPRSAARAHRRRSVAVAIVLGMSAAPATVAAAQVPPSDDAISAQVDPVRSATVDLAIAFVTPILAPPPVPAPDADGVPVRPEPAALTVRAVVRNGTGGDVAAPRLVIEVHDATDSRAALAEALIAADAELPARLATRDVSLGPDLLAGEVTAGSVTLDDEDLRVTGITARPGVHPIRVSVVSGTAVLDTTVTAVVVLDGPVATPLDTIVTWPLTGPPMRGVGGAHPARADVAWRDGGRLQRLLRAAETASVTLTPIVGTHQLEDLLDRADGFESGGRTVSAQDPESRLAADRAARLTELLATSPSPPMTTVYADADLAAMAAAPAPLDSQAPELIREGVRRLQVLMPNVGVDQSTFAATVPMSPEALDLVTAGHVLLPFGATTAARGTAVASSDLPAPTMSDDALRQVRTPAGRVVLASVADPFVTAMLVGDGPSSPVARSQALTAMTAQLWFEDPDERRTLLLLPPADWDPAPRVPELVLDALDDAPWIAATTPITVSVGRTIGALPAITVGDAATAVPDALVGPLQRANIELVAVLDALPGDADVVDDREAGLLYDELLRATSGWWRGPDEARAIALVRDVQSAIDRAYGSVVVSEASGITLTSESGNIPVTIQRPDPTSIDVVVQIEGGTGALAWPAGQSVPVTLQGGATQTVSIAVEARTRGTFPITVIVRDPLGRRELDRATLRVTSTAVSRPALFAVVGIAALVALAGSWRRRREPPTLAAVPDDSPDPAVETVP